MNTSREENKPNRSELKPHQLMESNRCINKENTNINRAEGKPDPTEQKLQQLMQSKQHVVKLMKLINDPKIDKNIVKPLEDINSFQDHMATGAQAGSVVGPVGMIIGSIIGAVSFIKGRKQAKKNAKKPDPFIEYLNANFEKINDELNAIKKSLQEMKEQLSDISERQIFTINLLHDGLTGLYQQNYYLEITIIKLNQKVIDHVNRVQKTIEIQNRDNDEYKYKESWRKAEHWMKWNEDKASVNNKESEIQDLLLNLYNIICRDGLASRPSLNGSTSFKTNQVSNSTLTKDEWMLGELNNRKSPAELTAFIASCGEDRYNWVLDSDIKIDDLPNILVWQDGVDNYLEFIRFCLKRKFKFTEKMLNFEEIINTGNTLLKFIQHLQTSVILDLLNEYLSHIKNLETLVFEKFNTCMVVKNQDKRIYNYQNYLQKDETIEKLCAKIDFTLAMFRRCAQLAGYKENELSLLNNLFQSNQILKEYLTHSESVTQTKFRNGFPRIHPDLVKCICGENGIISVYEKKISLGNEYFSGKHTFHNTISGKISSVEELRSKIFPKSMEADSQNQQSLITPTTTNITEDIVESNKQELLSVAEKILSVNEKTAKNIKTNADVVFKKVIHNQTDPSARLVTTLPQHQQGFINHVKTLHTASFFNQRVAADKIEIAQLSKSDSHINLDKVHEMQNDLIKMNEEYKKSAYIAKQQNNINNNVNAKIASNNNKAKEEAQLRSRINRW